MKPDAAREINLVVANPQNGMVRLLLTIEGKSESFVIAKHVAAHAVAQITAALSKSA